MLKSIGVFVFSLIMSITAFGVQAAEVGTKEEAVEMVKNVQAFYKKNGLDATVKAINSKDPRFLNKDLYVFLVSNKGVMTAHGFKPALSGVDMINMKDVKGTLITRGILKLLKTSDSGWFNYMWTDPKTKVLQDKASYVEKIGKDHFVGVGVYLKK